jgi:hypothetical protein
MKRSLYQKLAVWADTLRGDPSRPSKIRLSTSRRPPTRWVHLLAPPGIIGFRPLWRQEVVNYALNRRSNGKRHRWSARRQAGEVAHVAGGHANWRCWTPARMMPCPASMPPRKAR